MTEKTTAHEPTLAEQATFFDDWNASYRAQGFDGIEHESRARNKVLEILRTLPLTRPAILEVGCGTGWFSEKLAEFGKVTAIDLSEKAISMARRRGLGAEFVAGDFYTWDASGRHFDVAICVETISCVPDRPAFVEKLASVVAPGAYLILTAQNKFVYERRSDVRPAQPGLIRGWLSRRQLHRLLRRDFRVLKSATVLPKGDRGMLRILNSHKVSWALRRVFSEASITRAKERLGLGHCRVVLARRRGP